MKPILQPRVLDLSRSEPPLPAVSEEVVEKPHMSRTRSVVLPEDVPAKRLYGVNIKDIDVYKTARTKVKHEKLMRQFVENTKKWLDCVDTKYSSAILVKVMQMAEYAFACQKKSGPLKKRAVIECVKCFYDENDILVDALIEDMLPKVVRASWLRRLEAMLYDYFFC